MPFSREICSLPLSASQKKMLNEKGFNLVNDIDSDTNLGFSIEGLLKAPETKNAAALLVEEKHTREIKSFLGSFDDFLKGVLRPGLITEFVGLPGSGRTQLCLHLSVSAQIVDFSLNGATVYICTNLDFSISRLKEIIDNYLNKVQCFKKFNKTDISRNIHLINITTAEELVASLELLKEFVQKTDKITLVVIDSITYPFRLCERTKRTFLMHSTISQLRSLARIHNFSVVLTNDMTTVVGMNGNEIVPSLRDTFYHLINNRILLSQTNNTFAAEILKCSAKFPMKCNFMFLDDVT